jgi:hypothetical protein
MNKIFTNVFMAFFMITFMLWGAPNKAMGQCSTNTAQQQIAGYSYWDAAAGYWTNGQLAVTLSNTCAPSAHPELYVRKKQFGAQWKLIPSSGILSPWSATQTAAMTVTTPTVPAAQTVIDSAGFIANGLYEFMFVYASSACSSSVATMKMVVNTPLALHQLDLSYERDYLWLTYEMDQAIDFTKYDVIYTDEKGAQETIAQNEMMLQDMKGKIRLPLTIKKNGTYQVVAYGIDNQKIYSNTIEVRSLPMYYLDIQQEGNIFTCISANGFDVFDLAGRLLLHEQGERISVENLVPGTYIIKPLHPSVVKGEMKFIQ